MWIEGAIATLTVLAPGFGSDAVEPVGDARGMDGSPSYVQAQQVQEPRIWVDHGVDPVLDAGDRVRVYYRTSDDAYVAIFQIDTDGTTRMLFPRSPTENHYARADRDYQLLCPHSAYWNVDDQPGIGYLFIVTSPTPFNLSDFRYSHYDGGWDLSAVGSTVYSDPYVAMDDYVVRLVPDWEFVSYGLDFISYNVVGTHEFPRFLCYQCHGFRPYATWNPYQYTCADFRVVVYNDPYFYPSDRDRANRVVMVGPRNPPPPRFEFKERAAGDPGTPVTVVRQSRRGDSPPAADQPSPGQRRGNGRVASPRVAPRRATTRRPDVSGRDGAPQVRTRSGWVTPPPVDARVLRRPTLERRSAPPNVGTRPPPERARSKLMPPPRKPQTDRPSTARPDNPRAGSPSRGQSSSSSSRPPRERSSGSPSARQPSSTRRSPERSNGSPTARPAPRERQRTASGEQRIH